MICLNSWRHANIQQKSVLWITVDKYKGSLIIFTKIRVLFALVKGCSWVVPGVCHYPVDTWCHCCWIYYHKWSNVAVSGSWFSPNAGYLDCLGEGHRPYCGFLWRKHRGQRSCKPQHKKTTQKSETWKSKATKCFQKLPASPKLVWEAKKGRSHKLSANRSEREPMEVKQFYKVFGKFIEYITNHIMTNETNDQSLEKIAINI